MGANDSGVIGQSVRRKEDVRFLTGAGQYTDDVVMPRQTYAYFLRSPHAHAKIRKIDVAKAKAAPGVVDIFTGADLTGVNGLPCGWLITGTDGKPMNEPPHPVLAQGKVRHVGDQVALVIAESAHEAKDAAELIDVDYEVLPAVVNCVDALKPGAPQIHEQAPGNKCYTWALGDKAAVDAAFAKAAHVSKLDIVNNRLIPNAIEPRAAVASYNRSDESYTLYVANQNPHVERLLMTAFVLGLPETKVRVIAPDVGGGFGSKIYLYAEETAMVWASKKVNRPIKWAADRSEAFLTDAHGRDHVTHVELALDKDGKFLAMRVITTANMGAYLSTFASCIPTILYATLLAGQYTTPAIFCEVTASFTNTAPVDAYRGAGRPEATFVVERIVHQAAVDMKIPQDEIRRRNFIRTFPYATPVALTYDTGNYDATLDGAMKVADTNGLRRAQGGVGQARQAARDRLRVVHRGVRAGAVERGGRAGRARGPVRGGRGPRESDRQRHGVHRLAQPRPGPRNDVRADRRRPARHRHRQCRGRARRHGPHPVRHGHLRLALAVGGRHGDREGARQGDREGQEDRRAPARSGRDRHRVQGRQVHGGGHRPQQGVRGGLARRLRAAQLSARQARAGPRTRRRSTIRRTSRIRRARTSAKSRSIRRPAWSPSSTSPRATTSATSSIR